LDFARTRRELPSLHQLPGLCGTVSAERWDQFETLFEKTTCNDFCVAKGLAPWKADDYVNTKQPLVYEDVCKGRVAIMNTVRWHGPQGHKMTL